MIQCNTNTNQHKFQNFCNNAFYDHAFLLNFIQTCNQGTQERVGEDNGSHNSWAISEKLRPFLYS